MSLALGIVCAGAIAARFAGQYGLERLNQRHVLAHRAEVPEAFREIIDPPTYAKSVDYTLAKSRHQMAEAALDTAILAAALWSGLLPWLYSLHGKYFGTGVWAGSGFLIAIAILLSLPALPLSWREQFRLEARFGFNTTTQKTWWADRLKGVLLGVALGWPLLALILKCVDRLGEFWWVWAWASVVAFQFVMMIVAPVLILPLFNKLTPLPEGALREQLMGLARRVGFPAKDIQVMDGSKRSRHSNAFFAGLGRFRKIVLFDTLIEQLTPVELEAVLAHEIGHYKKRHIPKMMAWSILSLFAGFFVLSVLARQPWFPETFGFEPVELPPILLLFALLSGAFTFWISPLTNKWSRRYEYEADAYAREAMQQSAPLVGALRKLNEKNLSNLTPHPAYSRFYYSHPTLVERETALTLDSNAPHA